MTICKLSMISFWSFDRTLYSRDFQFWKFWTNAKVSTTFAPAENSTFSLNEWFMHARLHIITHVYTCMYIYM